MFKMAFYQYVFTLLVIGLMLFGCSAPSKKNDSEQYIADKNMQESLYANLIKLTNDAIPVHVIKDSLVFLILPVEASCPACRRKVVDSIIKYQGRLPDDHIIVLSASGGKKLIRSYFMEQQKDLPDMPGQLFLDSTNQAYQLGLFKDNPTVYYTGNGKAYRKVSVIPATIKSDLKGYFYSITYHKGKKKFISNDLH